jgi:hypothetical protein
LEKIDVKDKQTKQAINNKECKVHQRLANAKQGNEWQRISSLKNKENWHK